jgi:hypothetical protein
MTFWNNPVWEYLIQNSVKTDGKFVCLVHSTEKPFKYKTVSAAKKCIQQVVAIRGHSAQNSVVEVAKNVCTKCKGIAILSGI